MLIGHADFFTLFSHTRIKWTVISDITKDLAMYQKLRRLMENRRTASGFRHGDCTPSSSELNASTEAWQFYHRVVLKLGGLAFAIVNRIGRQASGIQTPHYTRDIAKKTAPFCRIFPANEVACKGDLIKGLVGAEKCTKWRLGNVGVSKRNLPIPERVFIVRCYSPRTVDLTNRIKPSFYILFSLSAPRYFSELLLNAFQKARAAIQARRQTFPTLLNSTLEYDRLSGVTGNYYTIRGSKEIAPMALEMLMNQDLDLTPVVQVLGSSLSWWVLHTVSFIRDAQVDNGSKWRDTGILFLEYGVDHVFTSCHEFSPSHLLRLLNGITVNASLKPTVKKCHCEGKDLLGLNNNSTQYTRAYCEAARRTIPTTWEHVYHISSKDEKDVGDSRIKTKVRFRRTME
ncbi:uncharacterized protein BDR25DRAFT_352295 [Lindgomyces ingoldianus]|uniref:Uncharacterized protein n=1 Tax=Lindgomyces ingoldianus TaxID=673940 RepID=A0ACB6R3U0_9PLEO|nr:uncharacterized protein BDR25DRAFT_352295 [Lindgomyces ingoldianus]KAF2473816.1 hypothetical protein BDR25DRAFT_352295 [Lindgomyces ingoldianus]